jgi:hypothetical protein
LLYNDRSVLENHHAAAAWSLLLGNPGLNFLSELAPADFKRFRFIVIEQILSTDLKKHFDFMSEWNTKIPEAGGSLNFESESDRLLIGQMAIKVADISGPSKPWDLHYSWTQRIVEEFYQQGEDELSLGMPLSPYMDRSTPKLPQLQSSFIKHLVCPLYVAYEKAGVMPGEWVDAASDDEDSDDATDPDYVAGSGPKKVGRYPLIEYINENHERWLKIIAEEEATEGVQQTDGDVANSFDPSSNNTVASNKSETNRIETSSDVTENSTDVELRNQSTSDSDSSNSLRHKLERHANVNS